MSSKSIRELLPLGQRIILFDGGMGTQLIARGLKAGEEPERWNLTRPATVEAVHAAYLAAGCDVVTANTFGASPLKLGDASGAVIRAGVALARRAVAARGHGVVAMDLGPLGRLLAPAGDLSFEDALSQFRQMAETGRGADLMLIETMGDPYEMKAAVLGVREACDLPIAATFTADAAGRLLTGGDVETMAVLLDSLGVDLIGLNCSLGGEELLPLLRRVRRVTDRPLIVQPNAGLPRMENGAAVYPHDPAVFAGHARRLAESGAWALGGCCGTTPAHIAALAQACDGMAPQPIPPVEGLWVSSGVRAADLLSLRPALIGERLNPTGKRAMKEALRAGDLSWLQREALRQEEAGADVLDLNVGLPEVDEPDWMARAVPGVQAVSSLPLQLDSPDPEALSRGLRLVNGKAIVNSVSGKDQTLDAVLPLISRYGGCVVGLLLDESGIPETVSGRLAVAEKIVDRCLRSGISRRNILLDPLTLTLSTGEMNARVTLETLRLVRERLGVETVLGVSNISFGLPDRPRLTGAFLAAAMQAGLAAAIVNPLSAPVMDACACARTVLGLDPGCEAYMRRFGAQAAPEPPAQEAPGLKAAVRRGLEADAIRAAQSLLDGGTPPMTLVEEQLLPALRETGDDYAAGRSFLPQLIMSAQAAQGAFALVERALAEAGKQRPCAGRLCLATVEGDVHDIGKNIVRVLLSSYGFQVLDLGKNVPARRVLEAARAEGIRLVGLSALMTTTVPAMEETVSLLHRELPGCSVIVGGAVLTPDLARQIGADGYCRDAMETVRWAQAFFARADGSAEKGE